MVKLEFCNSNLCSFISPTTKSPLQSLYKLCSCSCYLSNAVYYSTAQNINSLERVHPVSIHPATTARLWAQFWTDLHQIWNMASPSHPEENISLGSPWNVRGHGHVTKLVLWYPLLISGTVKDWAFIFYAELMMEEYNKIYTQESP